MTNKKLTFILCLIGVLTLSIIVWAFPSKDAKGGTLELEVFKLLAQFFLVGILGVVISLIVQKYNRQRDKELLINDLRKTVLEKLIHAYSDTKKSRRIFMANRLKGNKILFILFDEQMRNLVDIQLSLEILVHQIKTSRIYFGSAVDENIIDKITVMEKYLGDIIDEYKDSLLKFATTPKYIEIDKFETIKLWFGREHEERNFRKIFVYSYREAVEEIRRQIWTDL